LKKADEEMRLMRLASSGTDWLPSFMVFRVLRTPIDPIPGHWIKSDYGLKQGFPNSSLTQSLLAEFRKPAVEMSLAFGTPQASLSLARVLKA